MRGSVHRRRAAARAAPATAMNATTCPNNRDVGSSQMSMWFVLVATPKIGTSERVRPVKPARAVGEARRHDEHRDRPHHPDANRSDVFVLRPYNTEITCEARSLAPASSGSSHRWTAPHSLERWNDHCLLALLGKRCGRERRDHKLTVTFVKYSDLLARQACDV